MCVFAVPVRFVFSYVDSFVCVLISSFFAFFEIFFCFLSRWQGMHHDRQYREYEHEHRTPHKTIVLDLQHSEHKGGCQAAKSEICQCQRSLYVVAQVFPIRHSHNITSDDIVCE